MSPNLDHTIFLWNKILEQQQDKEHEDNVHLEITNREGGRDLESNLCIYPFCYIHKRIYLVSSFKDRKKDILNDCFLLTFSF